MSIATRKTDLGLKGSHMHTARVSLAITILTLATGPVVAQTLRLDRDGGFPFQFDKGAAAATSKANGRTARSMRALRRSKQMPTSAFVAASKARRGSLIPSPTSVGVAMCRVARSPKSSATGRKNCSGASISSVILTTTADRVE